jgi:hypothetical protein
VGKPSFAKRRTFAYNPRVVAASSVTALQAINRILKFNKIVVSVARA